MSVDCRRHRQQWFGAEDTLDRYGYTRYTMHTENNIQSDTADFATGAGSSFREHRGCIKKIWTCGFYPREAMLARYLLSSRVCPSVRPSQVGGLRKRLNIGPRKQRRAIALWL